MPELYEYDYLIKFYDESGMFLGSDSFTAKEESEENARDKVFSYVEIQADYIGADDYVVQLIDVH